MADVAEIRVERKQSSAVPWILGIVVVTLLLLWGLKEASTHSRATVPHRATSAVDTFRDPAPPILRQVAQAALGPGESRAA